MILHYELYLRKDDYAIHTIIDLAESLTFVIKETQQIFFENLFHCFWFKTYLSYRLKYKLVHEHMGHSAPLGVLK